MFHQKSDSASAYKTTPITEPCRYEEDLRLVDLSFTSTKVPYYRQLRRWLIRQSSTRSESRGGGIQNPPTTAYATSFTPHQRDFRFVGEQKELVERPDIPHSQAGRPYKRANSKREWEIVKIFRERRRGKKLEYEVQ